MAELLPERLGLLHYADEDQLRGTKPKHQETISIVEWLQCFGIYIAVITHTKPHRTVDLLGYQNLIVQGYLKYQEGCWADYDRHFRQKASASPVLEWSAIDTTLWNLAFSGRAAMQLSGDGRLHGEVHCHESLPIHHRIPRQTSSFSRKQPIYLEWNESLSPGCPHPACRYEHSCYQCVHNPSIADKYHKAIFCPNKEKKSQ